MPMSWTGVLPALITFLVGGLLAVLLGVVLQRVLRKITGRTTSTSNQFIAAVLVDTLPPLGWVLSASLAWQILPTSTNSDRIAFGLAKLLLVVLVVRLVNRIGIRLLQRGAQRSSDEAVANLLLSLAPLVKALVWSLGAVVYLQNIGVQMAAIWALLSAGGIGAGLALKEPVSQFFEYITILLDKPFQPGQLIHVGEVWGTVEKVGVRSTRLRSVNGEAVVMSNSALTGAVVANYGSMQRRRLICRLGVSYDTTTEKLEQIPELLKGIVSQGGDASFDRCHFVSFNDSSLDFELVYFVPTNDFNQAMDVQQRINLEIVRCFARAGITFAFPTRTLHLLGEKAG
jgi:MscS family membrane protein